jgi:hypothetical protein
MRKLEQRQAPAAPAPAEPAPSAAADALAAEPFVLQAQVQTPAPKGLLLKDATLEDIVRHLHAKNIEPTFRFKL